MIPCYRQERFLGRTLAALERSLAGRDWLGVLVLAAADGDAPLPERSPHWRVLRASGDPGTRPLTPGAARNAGFEACGGTWVLFVDADVEVEAAWVERATPELRRGGPSLAHGTLLRARPGAAALHRPARGR